MESNSNSTSQEVIVRLSDKQFTRLLDVQEYDKQTQDEAIGHILELGLSARENSIAATKKRKSQEKLAANLEAFNKFLALAPDTVNDPAKLLKVMQSFGIGVNSLVTEVAKQAEATTICNDYSVCKPKGYYKLFCAHDKAYWCVCGMCRRDRKEAIANWVRLCSHTL
jgi:hypothetical protein